MMIIKHLGLEEYEVVWQAMQKFTLARDLNTADEIWLVQHPPVFTQGQAGKPEHILKKSSIPIVQSDRGGQVTYHGPGQLIIYFLLDCRRRHLSIRQLVTGIEQICIAVLQDFNISAETKCAAPGVYVAGKKIASLGLRIKNHCSYHGLALNIDMDLKPFNYINPCGFSHMEMTQMKDLNPKLSLAEVAAVFEEKLSHPMLFQDLTCTISKP